MPKFVAMDTQLKLYMVLLGCTPKGRLTEQHDIFFGIGTSVTAMLEDMYAFWPDGGRLHIDSWREVTQVGDHSISIVPRADTEPHGNNLFFLNLGGYRPGEFEEYHYKTLVVTGTMAEAVKAARQTTFYKHYGFKGAESHIDDKYALDIDDMHKVQDILPFRLKQQYSLKITRNEGIPEDPLQIGYLKLPAR